MFELLNNIGFVSFSVAAAAYMGLCILILANRQTSQTSLFLLAAAAVSVVWAVALAWAAARAGGEPGLFPEAEAVRNIVWFVFLYKLITAVSSGRGGSRFSLNASLVLGGGAAVVLIWIGLFQPELLPLAPDQHMQTSTLGVVAYMGIAMAGIILVENLYRNSHPENRWTIQTLCLGLFVVFLIDFVFAADWLLFRRVDFGLYVTRGLVTALAVPLIAISAARNPSWRLQVQISRKFVFHSLSALAGGAYLVVLAVAGFYFREIGGDWGTVFQLTFFVAGMIFLALLIASSRFRARARLFITKHFFSYKYDYRDEWLNFVKTVSSEASGLDLHQRAIKSIASIVDSPGGWLWLRHGDGTYRPKNRWNFRQASTGIEPKGSQFVRRLMDRQWIVDFDELRKTQGGAESSALPPWASGVEDGWLGVPLLHLDDLTGFVVLEKARVKRDLEWEDFDLLRIVAQQAASYVAEYESLNALAEARQFESFNRRFAFVMHDIKNLSSQLALVVKNAEKHGDNKDFQRDMLATVGNSVDKMEALLARISESSELGAKASDFEMTALLDDICREMNPGDNVVRHAKSDSPVWITGDEDRITMMCRHIIQNAIDATNAKGNVLVKADIDGSFAVITVKDDGRGMEEKFVRLELFKPFRSTKKEGYGIGAYESLQIAEDHNGSIKVSSRPDEGAEFVIRLPLSKRSMAQSLKPGVQE